MPNILGMKEELSFYFYFYLYLLLLKTFMSYLVLIWAVFLIASSWWFLENGERLSVVSQWASLGLGMSVRENIGTYLRTFLSAAFTAWKVEMVEKILSFCVTNNIKIKQSKRKW